jgi:rhodanese-related sulfurtransferase
MANPISKDEVQQKQSEKKIVKLVDIRTAAEYEKQHVTGSIHIPTEQLSNAFSSFDKNDTIVCICNYGKERGQQAAELLHNAGFENTYYLKGGAAEWYDNDLSK